MSTDNQVLLLVNENDQFFGKYETRKKCHTGKGLHHRAFVVLLANKKGEVLLQKRKHTLWNNYWDITAATHVLHLKDHDETYKEAAQRALLSEMGISDVVLKKVGGFNYYASYGENCENEYCAILTGTYNGSVKPDQDAVYQYQWTRKNEFIENCLKEVQTYTPWAILTGKFLAKRLW